MFEKNQTTVAEFLLLGFQSHPISNAVLFVLFLEIYSFTIIGNVLIIMLVETVQSLMLPMYYFLAQLSLCDIILSTNIVPNLLQVLLNGGSAISFSGCLTQLYFHGTATAAECLLLTSMSYDRYLAICWPLHYASIMDLRLQFHLVLWSWLLACVVMLFTVFLICDLEFCGANTVDHYFCDISPILELSCSDHTINDITYFTFAIFLAVIPFFFIVFTYVLIFTTILGISSKGMRQKTWSTCSSHLTVVTTYYGTLITIYMAPSKGQPFNVNKAISLLYTLGTPFCNPIVYSFKNKEIKSVLVKYLSGRTV